MSRSMPAEYTVHAGAGCTQTDGSTILSFTRRLAATSDQQRSITPGFVQSVIYAYGDDGVTSLGYHGSNRGGAVIDFGETFVSTLAPTPSPTSPRFIELCVGDDSQCAGSSQATCVRLSNQGADCRLSSEGLFSGSPGACVGTDPRCSVSNTLNCTLLDVCKWRAAFSVV